MASASANLLKQAVPSSGKQQSSPKASMAKSASEALLQSAGIPSAGLKYVVPKDDAVTKKKTLGQKVKKAAVEVGKAILSPVATTVARPFQAATELAGVSDERVNKFTLGGLIAPTPQNYRDITRDIGRGIQTAAFGIPVTTLPKVLAGGATFGLGASLEEGNKLASKETATEILKNAALAGVSHGVLKGLGKVFSKKATPVVESTIPEQVAPKQKAPTGTIIKSTEEVLPKKTTKLKIDTDISKAKASGQSFDEWVKGQPTYYHGGAKDIQEIKMGKSNFQKTFYMSDNPDYAKSYGGNNSSLNEIAIDTKANLADLRKPSNDLINQIRNKIEAKPTGKTVKITRPDGSILELPETKGGKSSGIYSTTQIIQGIKDGKAMFAELPEVKQALKELGYDGLITQESKFGANYGVWNKDVLKTRSQLKAEWDKAGDKNGLYRASVENGKIKTEKNSDYYYNQKRNSYKEKLPTKATKTVSKPVRTVDNNKLLKSIDSEYSDVKDSSFVSRNFSERKAKLDSEDIDYIKDVAISGKKEKFDIPREFYIKYLEVHADEVGDTLLQKQLSTISGLQSKTGQSLGSLAYGGKNTVSNILRDIRKSLDERLKKAGVDIEDGYKQFEENLSTKFDELQGIPLTKADVADILEDIICK